MKWSSIEQSNIPLMIQPESRVESSLSMLQQWIRSNLNLLYKKLHHHGGILFRGFAIENASDFIETIKIISPQLLNYKGGDSPREKVLPEVYTSTNHPSEYAIALHNEMSYSKNYPALIYFFSEVVAAKGGETPLLDGRTLYLKLKPEILNKFQSKKIKYVMNLHGGYGLGKSWQICFETSQPEEVDQYLKSINAVYFWKKDGGLRIECVMDPVILHPTTGEKVFFSQADQWHPSYLGAEQLKDLKLLMSEDDFHHHCYYGDGTAIEEDFLDHIRTAASENAVMFPWEKNDLLMLDNILALHGRSPYQGDRRVLVAMA